MSEKDKKKKTPHLAVCHSLQGGSANNRHVSLIMKSVDQMTPEAKEAATMLLNESVQTEAPKEDIEKASYNSLYSKLNKAVDDAAKGKDRWGWSYVRDFDDTHVVFSTGEGLFASTYSVSGNEVELGSEWTFVNEMVSWENDKGEVVVSQSDNIPVSVGSLVMKSFEVVKADDEKVKEIFKSKYEETKQMEELNTQITSLQGEVEKAKEDLSAANKLVEALKAELEEKKAVEKSSRDAQRLEIVKSVVSEDKAEELFKSLEALNDESFDTVIKSMQTVQVKADEDNPLLKRVSKDGVEKATKSDLEVLQEMLKEE